MEEKPKLESKFEMRPEALEVISTFQKAKETSNKEEQIKLFEEFKVQLVKLIQPRVMPYNRPSIAELQSLPRVLTTGEKRSFGDSTIFLGGGTAGQRIYLESWVTIYNDPAKAEKLGYNALKEDFDGSGKEITLKSKDGQPRWMMYHKPEGGDWRFGEKYWKKFVEVFGDEIVDLLKPL